MSDLTIKDGIPAGFQWPRDEKGKPKAVAYSPALEMYMCSDCWNNQHPKKGCVTPGCQCGCYQGRNKGLASVHPPHRDCKENQSFPDVGSFRV